MPVTYTNRKGRTYTLCRVTTKAGRARYVFAREPRGEVVDDIPEGYEIRENVNGVVSLAKIRPPQLLPEEIAVVERALARHPESRNYRFEAKGKQITIYERVGSDVKEIMAYLGLPVQLDALRAEALQEDFDRRARYVPEMRFTLEDEKTRRFGAERWCYRGRIDGWLELLEWGPIKKLAPKLIRTLGTDDFFELF